MVIYLFYPFYLIKCHLMSGRAGGRQRFIKILSKNKIIRKIILIITYPILNFNKSLKDQQKFILKVLFLAMLTLITNYSFNVLLNVAPPSLILLVLIVFSALYCNIFLIFIILQIMFGISKQYALLNKNSNSGCGAPPAALNLNFLQNDFKKLMETGPDSFNYLNGLENVSQSKESIVSFKDGKLIIGWRSPKRCGDYVPTLTNFLLKHREWLRGSASRPILYNGIGSALTIMLYYSAGGSGSALSAARLAVKLHLKALDKGPEADKYFHSLSDKQRADLLKVRMQTISRFKTTAGGGAGARVLVAFSLFGILKIISNYLLTKKSATSVTSLIPMFKNKGGAAGEASQPRSQPAAKIYNNKNNKPNKPNNKDFWKYFLLFILCFTITNILHFLGYSYITDLISIYKIGLILNLLFGYIIVYNSIAMYLVNYNPQREIEKHTIYKYLPKFTKNFLSLYDTNHPELIKAMNKLLIGGIVVSILIMVIINVVLLFI